MIFDVALEFITNIFDLFSDTSSPLFYVIGYAIIVGIISLITDLYTNKI